MKFKVIEADWYCIFGDRMGSWRLKTGSASAQAHYEYELEEYTKNGDKCNYDGPLRYIEKCEDPGFPIREGLKYCVRILPEGEEVEIETLEGVLPKVTYPDYIAIGVKGELYANTQEFVEKNLEIL